MSTVRQSIIKNAVGLGLFAFFTAGLIATSYSLTRERVILNAEAYAARILYELVPATYFDQPIEQQQLALADPAQWQGLARLGLRSARPAYRAMVNDAVTAVVLPATTPDGYTGDIHLLIAIDAMGQLLGVRVVEHKETPGLGDAIEADKSRWIHQFVGKSLGNPRPDRWAVQKDGGDFDQLTGATITPRAVVRAVRDSLEFFADNRPALLFPEPSSLSENEQP
ncbi:electron transport complex subunit RsxG [Salinispirillum marinum]|uniref:Ion-translocating oxidoreductase complex subunit G n=2 Tax=Saccharospirillaceae TaxID=255527 RepID=A0ABV8BHM8_9GAMM